MRVVLGGIVVVLVVIVMTRRDTVTQNPPVTQGQAPTTAGTSDEEAAAGVLHSTAMPQPAEHGRGTLLGADPAAGDISTAAAACDYYAGTADPAYVMDNGFIDWDAYWQQANNYAVQRTGRYTPEERLLATAIWSEQKTDATTAEAQQTRREAMVAIGYVILHRRDQTEGWFGDTNTISEVLNDTRQDIQFQGYWRWRDTNVLESYLLHKKQDGVVIQPGIGWESPDRAVWFEALDLARGVLRGCEQDVMPNSLFFGHGDFIRQLMQQRAQQDDAFAYIGFDELDLWISNERFR